MSKKKNELMALKADDFADVLKKRLVEKYADDALRLIEDTKKTQKALNKFQKWVDRVETGDFTAIDEYKKARTKLENEDEYEMG